MPCWEKQFRKQQHQTCPGQKRKWVRARLRTAVLTLSSHFCL
jgi:hypothetical protein